MSKNKSPNRQKFLLTFFNSKEEYQTKEVNNFILVKYHNKSSKKWEVQIFTPKSFKIAQQYYQKLKVPDPQVSNKDQTTIFKVDGKAR